MAALVSEHEAVLGGISRGGVRGRPGRPDHGGQRRGAPAARAGGAPGRRRSPRPGCRDRLLALLGEQSRAAAPATARAGPDAGRSCWSPATGRWSRTLRPVTRRQRWLGIVVSVRDRTDVELLTRQLDAVQTMSTALRAQRHEFANRLHLLHGLIEAGRPEEADGLHPVGARRRAARLDAARAGLRGRSERAGVPVGQGRALPGAFGDAAAGPADLAAGAGGRPGRGDDGAGQPAGQRL